MGRCTVGTGRGNAGLCILAASNAGVRATTGHEFLSECCTNVFSSVCTIRRSSSGIEFVLGGTTRLKVRPSSYRLIRSACHVLLRAIARKVGSARVAAVLANKYRQWPGVFRNLWEGGGGVQWVYRRTGFACFGSRVWVREESYCTCEYVWSSDPIM